MFLEVNNLVKKYKDGFYANQDISFTVEKGQVFGVLGPSGAGKTTLINQIMGLSTPTSGSIYINGKNIVDSPKYARKICSYAPQSYVPINGMTPIQAIEIVGRLRGGDKKLVRKCGIEMLESLEITDWINKPCERLSGGIKRLVSFSLATVEPGELIILDEPTNDVDPMRRRLLWNKIRQLAASGTTVLLVTHNVLEAEKAVEHLAIIDKGRLIKKGTPAELKEYNEDDLVVEMILSHKKHEIEIPDFLNVSFKDNKHVRLIVKQDMLIQCVKWIQTQKNAEIIEEYTIGPLSLEDAYLHITKGLD